MGMPRIKGNVKLKKKKINFYKSGKFKEALAAFTEVYATTHHDVTANLYISRCNRFIKHGIPEDWDGIERIDWN